MKKAIKFIIAGNFIFFVLLCLYFFAGSAPSQKDIIWGVNFSQMGSENLKLDWRKNYLALIEDAGVKHIKLITNWDYVENKKGHFYFDDIDWQVRQAEGHGVKLVFVAGLKTGRWPECHDPKWARDLPENDEKKQAFEYLSQMIMRYKDSKAIEMWQVENEPLFHFGECPSWYYGGSDFLKQEVALVKSLDDTRKIMVTDSGEQSMWWDASRIGDVMGTTMYINAWWHITDSIGTYVHSILPPVFYWRKATLVKFIFNKNVICGELQAEPWASRTFYDVPLQEQEKTMSQQKFLENIEYAKRTGLKEFYLWGGEWWYWMKEKQSRPEIWNEAKKLFN